MDLIYIPEVLTYGSFRNPQYQDYEQPWNKDCFGYGPSTRYQRIQQNQQPLHEYYKQQRKQQVSKENCHLCRESKRRSLALYIRGKSRRSSCQEIHEEIEEEKEEEAEKNQEKRDNSSEIHDKNKANENFANKCATRA